MKLYTEKQLREAYNLGFVDGYAVEERYKYSAISLLTPIELPNDDEIARVGLDFSVGYNVEYWNGFKHCGDWMKEQILNQNK